MWVDVEESETDRDNQRRKEGEDGEEKELGKSSTYMQFVIVELRFSQQC